MMDMEKKRKLVEELLEHLDTSQGGDLKKMIESAQAPIKPLEKSEDSEPVGIEAKPKGISVEKVEVIKPKGDMDAKVDEALGEKDEPSEEIGDKLPLDMEKKDDEKLSDEELAELLKQYLGQ